jgi:hypothetical protein
MKTIIIISVFLASGSLSAQDSMNKSVLIAMSKTIEGQRLNRLVTNSIEQNTTIASRELVMVANIAIQKSVDLKINDMKLNIKPQNNQISLAYTLAYDF